MCTVSWTVSREACELFFNRDELNSRAGEEPPQTCRRDGVTYLAPRDGERGGTWLATNELGVTVGLLNDYACAWRPSDAGPRYSRGHVVEACAAASSHAEVIQILQAQPLARVAPFHLAVISPEEGPRVIHWQGLQLVTRETPAPMPPLTSSSFATDEIIGLRRERFSFFVRDPRAADSVELRAYHRQHARAAGAQSVLMCRPDASTRSIIHVRVGGGRVEMSYESVRWEPDGPVLAPALALTLSRRRLAA
jgi:hypothetical protein